ncbi:hypothetical protein OsJ_30029 [Oryza sativa Japonica Group]|uniref:Uncharacterized protein n=1 Tax=Oryza sativa subsp. japonica TaxID=39947 RepID=B9G4L2_ORYSJ|nr:hypothetical protein OsJ_30029 [Oryza sativa Japonica Group]
MAGSLSMARRDAEQGVTTCGANLYSAAQIRGRRRLTGSLSDRRDELPFLPLPSLTAHKEAQMSLVTKIESPMTSLAPYLALNWSRKLIDARNKNMEIRQCYCYPICDSSRFSNGNKSMIQLYQFLAYL